MSAAPTTAVGGASAAVCSPIALKVSPPSLTRPVHGRGCSDACGGIVGLFCAAGCEGVDEASFGRREWASRKAGDRKMAQQRRPPGEAEALEVAAFDFFGHGVAGEEGESEYFAGGAFDRLARAEFPDAGWADSERAQLFVDDLLRAGAGFGREEHELAEPCRWDGPMLEGYEAGLCDADDLVLEERVELDPLVGMGGADERELDAAGEQALEDFVAGGDLDLDGDAGVAAAEAAERVGEHVDAGRGRRAEVDRAGLQAGDRSEFLLCCAEAGERLGGAGGEYLAGVSEQTDEAGALDQPLAGGGFEYAQVLAGTRLADADRGGRRRDASLAFDFDQQAHPGGVPELAQGARC